MRHVSAGGVYEALGAGFGTPAGHEESEVPPEDLRVGGSVGLAGGYVGRLNGVWSELGRENGPYWKRPREDRQTGWDGPGRSSRIGAGWSQHGGAAGQRQGHSRGGDGCRAGVT